MILAIDCGSTNLKAALFDDRLRRVAEKSVVVRYLVRDGDRVEIDPEVFWSDCLEMIRQLQAPSPIDTVALTSQAQTFTVLDGAGRPQLPLVSWLDKRAGAEAAELQQRLGTDFHRHCSFPAPTSQLQLAQVLWARRHRLAAWGSEARVVTLPEFVARRLAGVGAVDRNLAAMGGLYSLERGDWWKESMDACGLDSSRFGKLVDVGGSVVGIPQVGEAPMAKNLRVVLAGNDQTAGAFGTIGRSGGVVLTLGTALVVYRFAGKMPGPFAPGGCWGPYPGGGYYELATRDEGCAALDWAVDQLTPGADPDRFRHLAATAPAGAALFYPGRIGREDAWIGSGDRAGRARAVLEGIGFSARHLLVDELGLKPGGQPVSVIGGGSRSRFWLQMLADILNWPVRPGDGDTLRGCAMMAGGMDGATGQAGDPAGEEILVPNADRAAAYAEIGRKWREGRWAR